ncbi:MAG TPA: hypothetical protein VJ952_11535, partial [Opitutales bacterium]|nr:hypothetical protein [Opitutales bacterium]
MSHPEPLSVYAKVNHLITGVLLLGLTGLLLPAAVAAQDVNVLIVGSSNTPSYSGTSSEAFDPVGIKTELEDILNGIHGSANVKVELIDRNSSSSSVYNLAHWFSYPYPAGVETTTRWPNLRGEDGTAWDCVVLIGDPYTIEYLPGLYTHGVSKVAKEVAASSNATPPETVLLMPWPGSGSDSTVDHYKEVVYRTGRTAGIKVAPGGLAWHAAGSNQTGQTNPDNDGAYIAAASIFSRIWGQNASTSSYSYDDALAQSVYDTVTANIGAPQYTGSFNPGGCFEINYDQRRRWALGYTGRSSDGMTAERLKTLLDENALQYGASSSNAIFFSWYNNYNTATSFAQSFYFYHMGNDNNKSNDSMLSEISTDNYYAEKRRNDRLSSSSNDNFRFLPTRYLWAQFHKLYPEVSPIGAQHYNHYGFVTSGAFLYTLFSGRCPLGPKPDPVTQQWNAERIGYETAWQMGRCQSRAPGFKTQPSNADKLRLAAGSTETLTTYFVLPPQEPVTVNVSIANSEVATVSPAQLTFTPENYATPQQVVVTCLSGAAASEVFDVEFSTVSADEVCDGLHESWQYTRSAPPTIASVWADETPVMRPDSAWVNVAASDPEGDPLGYSWSKASGPGRVSFGSPGEARTQAGFSTPGSYVLEVA